MKKAEHMMSSMTMGKLTAYQNDLGKIGLVGSA